LEAKYPRILVFYGNFTLAACFYFGSSSRFVKEIEISIKSNHTAICTLCLIGDLPIRVKLWHGDVGSHGSVWTAVPAAPAAATAGRRFECSVVGCDIVFFQAKMEGQGFQKQSTV
jgi:hypothetical protein